MKIKKENQELWALKGLLRERQKTYKDFGAEIGISANTLCNKLNGNTPFDTREITRIVQVLGIDNQQMIRYFFPNLLHQSI